MDHPYLKALHIIFVITWFAGLFYVPRLFIYATEAGEQPEPAKSILRKQYAGDVKRLWFGITWPSAVLTLIFGLATLISGNWHLILFRPEGRWLLIKLMFVVVLYGYHFSLHRLYKQQKKGIFGFSSMQLRLWNEVPTVLLIAIVMLVVVKSSLSLLWGIGGLLIFILLLMSAIRIYKRFRQQ